MDQLNKNRSSFKKLKDNAHPKTSKQFSYKTPKYIETMLEYKNHHFSKVKSNNLKPTKESLRETAPIEIYMSSNFVTENHQK